jgi:membrane protease YdiL (CAAX protease family)
MNLTRAFVNEKQRLRSGWRAAVFLCGYVVLAAVIASFAAAAFPGLITGGGPMFWVLNGLVSLVPAVLVGWLCGRKLEGLPFKALGCAFTAGWLRHLLIGSAMGTLAMCAAVAMAIAGGGLSFEINEAFDAAAIARGLAASFAIFAAGAAFEEALFRGYVLQTFTRAGWAWFAIALTALPFGIAHLRNPDANLISTANTVLAGVWFGLAYLKTRDLWFPFGIHLMWNWTQGSIFGIEVSGLTELSRPSLLAEIDRGPAWLTGTSYGAEGGIVCTIAILASIALIYFLPGLKPSEEMAALTDAEPAERSTAFGS